MTRKTEARAWRVLRGAWVLSSSGIVGTMSALFTIYFLTPLLAGAVGLPGVIEGAGVAAGAIEHAAQGDIVRLLLIALIISVSTQAGCVILFMKLTFKTASKPCVLQSDQGRAVVRDVLRECWKDARAQ